MTRLYMEQHDQAGLTEAKLTKGPKTEPGQQVQWAQHRARNHERGRDEHPKLPVAPIHLDKVAAQGL